MSTQPCLADERFKIIRSVGEECQTDDELRQLLTKKDHPRCYDGFEPSGRMHIAQGIFKAISVNKCVSAGCEFVFWVADWFALMNDKMGGNLERIQTVGQYFIEVWKVSGMRMSREELRHGEGKEGVPCVQFLWSSEHIAQRAEEYWFLVVDIARKNTLSRLMKCCQIMGRKEQGLSAAQILYPLMQCADIFFLKADICQLGLDQRKVNMLAREYCDHIRRRLKPIVLSHHMLQGLLEERDEDGILQKMSKSNPNSAIFMEDTREEIEMKIRQAYCPIQEDENPCLEYAKHLIYGSGRNLCNEPTYEQLRTQFLNGCITVDQLKNALVEELDGMLRPVREHFETDPHAKDLLEKVKKYREESKCQPVVGHNQRSPVSSARNAHLVAWLYPTLHLSLDEAEQICGGFQRFLSSKSEACDEQTTQGNIATLVLADWGGLAARCLTVSERKDVLLVLKYSADLLRAVGLPKEVRIVTQSDYMFQDSNNYWINLIQTGRRHSLELVASFASGKGGAAKELHAGHVVANLMQLNEAELFNSTHILGKSGAFGMKAGSTFFHAANVTYPTLSLLPVETYEWAIPSLGVPQEEEESNAPGENLDQILLCQDTEADVKRKIKRAYGPPADVQGNPLIALAERCIRWNSAIMTKSGDSTTNKPTAWIIARSEENGGSVQFESRGEIEDCYTKGQLHPGDLKSAIQKTLLQRMECVRNFLSSNEMKQQYSVGLKNILKKK